MTARRAIVTTVAVIVGAGHGIRIVRVIARREAADVAQAAVSDTIAIEVAAGVTLITDPVAVRVGAVIRWIVDSGRAVVAAVTIRVGANEPIRRIAIVGIPVVVPVHVVDEHGVEMKQVDVCSDGHPVGIVRVGLDRTVRPFDNPVPVKEVPEPQLLASGKLPSDFGPYRHVDRRQRRAEALFFRVEIRRPQDGHARGWRNGQSQRIQDSFDTQADLFGQRVQRHDDLRSGIQIRHGAAQRPAIVRVNRSGLQNDVDRARIFFFGRGPVTTRRADDKVDVAVLIHITHFGECRAGVLTHFRTHQ